VAGTIVAMGGISWEDEERVPLEDYWLGLTGKKRPRVLVVPTAVADAAEPTLSIVSQLTRRAEVSFVSFFPWPPSDLRELALGHDAIYVSGGNTANALAIWRVHGFDAILRDAWDAGVVLAGWSAGMICWFEAGVTDSFGPQLEGMRDGLGFLPGSACPHYDGEGERRPVYTRLVGEGFPAGLAADDCVALRFDGTELAETVTSREGSRAYRVSAEGEEPIEPRQL
jgi:dipeptidase E